MGTEPFRVIKIRKLYRIPCAPFVIIEDCLYAIEPFMEEVLPESREEKYYDYSDLEEIDEAAEEYFMAA